VKEVVRENCAFKRYRVGDGRRRRRNGRIEERGGNREGGREGERMREERERERESKRKRTREGVCLEET
jgi:hypothetical protein